MICVVVFRIGVIQDIEKIHIRCQKVFVDKLSPNAKVNYESGMPQT